MKRSVVVSYVFHRKNNLSDFKRFIDSINKYPPPKNTFVVISVKEIPKSLIIKMKEISKLSRLSLQIRFHEFPDFGFANGTHFFINEIYRPKIIICMTATSHFNNENWFNFLTRPFSNKKVGIVGSMLSYVSLRTNYYELMEVIIKNKFRIELTKHQKIVAIYHNIESRNPFFHIHDSDSRIIKFLINRAFNIHKIKYPIGHREFYPVFPNPHLRTTGFAIRGELLKEIVTCIPKNKIDELILESGYDGYSFKLNQLGHQVLVCTQNGEYLEIFDKNTFTHYVEFDSKSIVIDMHTGIFNRYRKDKKNAIQFLLRNPRKRSYLMKE